MMLGLIERLEAAEVGSRELDAAIWYALIETCGGKPDKDMIGRWPDYTTSLDAALALAERVLPGQEWRIGSGDGARTLPWARVGPWIDPDATGATPALALCIAILRARADLNTRSEGA